MSTKRSWYRRLQPCWNAWTEWRVLHSCTSQMPPLGCLPLPQSHCPLTDPASPFNKMVKDYCNKCNKSKSCTINIYRLIPVKSILLILIHIHVSTNFISMFMLKIWNKIFPIFVITNKKYHCYCIFDLELDEWLWLLSDINHLSKQEYSL